MELWDFCWNFGSLSLADLCVATFLRCKHSAQTVQSHFMDSIPAPNPAVAMALKSHAIKTTNYQMTFWVIKVLRSMAMNCCSIVLHPSIMEAFDDMWSWNAPLKHNLPHNTQSERLRNIWLIFSIGEHVCQGLSACSWSCRRFANFYFSCPTQDQAARWRQNFQKAKATAAQVQAELQKLDLLTGQDTAQRSAFSENGKNPRG